MKLQSNKRRSELSIRGIKYTVAEAGALAVEQQTAGNYQSALNIYNLILARFPDQPEVCNNRGVVLLAMNRQEDALASFKKAITLKPDHANSHHNLGCTFKRMNRLDEALLCFDRAIALKPDHAGAYNDRGVVLQELKRYEAALDSFDRAIALKPGQSEAYNNRGICLSIIGNMPEAEASFRKAMELKPGFAEPMFHLVNIRKYGSLYSPEVAQIRELLDKPGTSLKDREFHYFSLGKIYDDCNLYEEAFECFRQANQIRNAAVAYDPEQVAKMTDDIIGVFTGQYMSQPFPSATESKTPLFIVGMPRSGTTLLANILSNHRAIATAGELSAISSQISNLFEATGKNASYPEAVRHITPDLAARLINDYEKRLRRDIGAEAQHIIDKNPLNFKNLGYISKLFPKARVIHCTRNALDTGLSNYFRRFPLFLDYSFDLRNIGHFYLQYIRLMEHWRKTCQ